MPLIPANSAAAWQWLGQALTEFANGAFRGAHLRNTTVGTVTGGATAGLGGSFANSVIVFAAGFIASALFAGWERVHRWHETHEIPNPFTATPPPASPTNPPPSSP